MKLDFDWDEEKAKTNLKKHKISFEEAKTVYGDPFLHTFPDVEHSDEEERFVNIGCSAKGKVLVVIHTEREDKIRIISYCKATASEREFYEEGI